MGLARLSATRRGKSRLQKRANSPRLTRYYYRSQGAPQLFTSTLRLELPPSDSSLHGRKTRDVPRIAFSVDSSLAATLSMRIWVESTPPASSGRLSRMSTSPDTRALELQAFPGVCLAASFDLAAVHTSSADHRHGQTRNLHKYGHVIPSVIDQQISKKSPTDRIIFETEQQVTVRSARHGCNSPNRGGQSWGCTASRTCVSRTGCFQPTTLGRLERHHRQLTITPRFHRVNEKELQQCQHCDDDSRFHALGDLRRCIEGEFDR